jgi:hypothetical protein
MGCGSYTAHDWDKLKTAKAITRYSKANDLFKTDKFLDKFNPKFINVREARDNDEHPNSLPIAIGLDVTGSMGYLPEQIIKESLNELMKKLYASKVIPDPQLMFAAIGDVDDDAPLQVTQFESDIRIAEQLLELWLEGHGGDYPEDYALLWYFLAKHTDTDSMKKRNKKGYAFTIGDAPNHDILYRSDIKEIFSDEDKDYEYLEVAEMCEEKYNLFHIMINGSDNVIPGRTIYIDKHDIGYLPEIIITVICKIEGVDPAEILGDLDKNVEKIVNRAIKDINFGENIEI